MALPITNIFNEVISLKRKYSPPSGLSYFFTFLIVHVWLILHLKSHVATELSVSRLRYSYTVPFIIFSSRTSISVFSTFKRRESDDVWFLIGILPVSSADDRCQTYWRCKSEYHLHRNGNLVHSDLLIYQGATWWCGTDPKREQCQWVWSKW